MVDAEIYLKISSLICCYKNISDILILLKIHENIKNTFHFIQSIYIWLQAFLCPLKFLFN